jgi:hypothetical protein
MCTQAAELCSNWERKIEPDMQIEESDFTMEAYDSALKRLAELGHEPRDELSWFAEENAMKFVQGWLLKKAALESLERSRDEEDSQEVKSFCEFLVSKAFYHD